MKIEIWSDFACPFCYIGKHRLEEALHQFPHQDEVDVIFRSFELDPHAPTSGEDDLYDVIAKKYGTSREQAISMNNNVAEQGKAAGLIFHFDKVVPTNTFDAHRAFHYANEKGVGKALVEQLFQAYFTDGKHIGNKGVLAEIAVTVGLNKDEIANVLSNEDYSENVRNDQEEAKKLGVTGVPFFVINRKYAISGAQPLDVFAKALEKAWDDEK